MPQQSLSTANQETAEGRYRRSLKGPECLSEVGSESLYSSLCAETGP
jgi:hypothetical protein